MNSVPPSLLGRCEAGAFSDGDWSALARAIARAPLGRFLRHVPRITRTLVRQLELVPDALVHPSVLAVLSDLEVSADRWRTVRAELAKAGVARQRAIARRARSVGDRGAFWDLLADVHEAAFCESSPAVVPDLGDEFMPIAGAAAMRREALLMRNCLAKLVPDAAAGRSTYFQWIGGSDPVTVQLRRDGEAWKVGQLGACGNGPLPRATKTAIDRLLETALGEVASEAPTMDRETLAVAAVGRAHFGDKARRELAERLWSVHRRKRRTQNACVVAVDNRYAQFCVSRPSRSLWCEIAAHKFCPENSAWLTEAAVDLVERCGFRWPRGEQNFAREVAVASLGDCDRLAEFALGVHHALWGHGEDAPIETRVIG